MTLVLQNQGELGDLEAPRGGLRIRVLVNDHPTFERRHNDLYCRVAVSRAALMLGGVEVPTLDGWRSMPIPRSTKNGEVLRLKSAGMPDISGRGRGDLLVEVVFEPDD
jgi:molecular chaperone DnaJ